MHLASFVFKLNSPLPALFFWSTFTVSRFRLLFGISFLVILSTDLSRDFPIAGMIAHHVLTAHAVPALQELLNHANHANDSQWVIEVRTGDRKDSGTDAQVYVKIADQNDLWTDTIKLSKLGVNLHERGQTDTFPIEKKNISHAFLEPVRVEVWRDKFGLLDSTGSWLLDVITVRNIISGKQFFFPVHRWIKANQHYFFVLYDSTLPQDEQYHTQRKAELEEKRKTYQYNVNPKDNPILPVQSKTLPEDETFNFNYKLDIGMDKVRSMADKDLIALTTGGEFAQWKSFDELYKMYSFNFPLPSGERRWKTDEWFGEQRLSGCNPLLIRLCNGVPPKLGVDPQRAQKILGGMSLESAISEKRVFMVDLAILEKLPLEKGREVGCPIALFYLTEDRQQMLPLCIQLTQTPGPQNPVFYPDSQKEAWTLAKMWYNNADASYHQSISHLGMTHLQMEGIAVCANRNLSRSHPLYRLLAPHFLYLIAIDALGLQALINPGGWVDKTMTIACVGMFELIRRGGEQWRLDVNACPPADLKARGMDDKNLIPNYPYRDDATEVHSIILKYVTTIVNYYYDQPEKVLRDEELQSFVTELIRPKHENGVGIHGVPNTDGKITSVDQVITIMTGIITTCSMMHAAVNFCQYEEYGYPPNYPTRMNGQIPTKADGFTEQDVVNQLPTKTTTLDIMVITRILSSKGTNSLGDFEVQYLYDPVSMQAVKHLQRDLETLSEKIKERNASKTIRFPYEWLDPEIIPNAISI